MSKIIPWTSVVDGRRPQDEAHVIKRRIAGKCSRYYANGEWTLYATGATKYTPKAAATRAAQALNIKGLTVKLYEDEI